MTKQISLFTVTFLLMVITNLILGQTVPNLCTHESRFNSITQFVRYKSNKPVVSFFIASDGYYWLIDDNEIPSANNIKGKLPHGFRGDAAFYRQWPQCDHIVR